MHVPWAASESASCESVFVADARLELKRGYRRNEAVSAVCCSGNGGKEDGKVRIKINWIALLAGLVVAVALSSTTIRAQQCPKPSTPPPICNFDKSFCADTLQTCSGTAADWSSTNTNLDDVITTTVTQTVGKTTVVGFDSSSFTFINLNDTIQDTYDLYAWPATFEV